MCVCFLLEHSILRHTLFFFNDKKYFKITYLLSKLLQGIKASLLLTVEGIRGIQLYELYFL